MAEQIQRIDFTEDFLIGIDLIDEQHRFLVNMFNRLADHVARPVAQEETADIYGQLVEYSDYHFSTEERLMETVGYRELDSHRKQHRFFIERLRELKGSGAARPDLALDMAQFVGRWVQVHILVTDRQLGTFVATERPPESPSTSIDPDVRRFMDGDPERIKRDGAAREIGVHRLWLAGKSPRAAELEFVDMSGLSLDRVDLTSASLIGVNLAKSRLRGANLSNANLTGADLEEADLTAANLTGANLRGANLHRALLTDATLRGADLCPKTATIAGVGAGSDIETTPTVLTEAKLERAIFRNANLVHCDFTGADLVDADLVGADLSGAVMIGADLQGARLAGAILTGTVIDLATLDHEVLQAVEQAGGAIELRRVEITVHEFVNAIKEHETWIESAGTAGRRMDFDGVAIPAVKMSGRRLAGSRMRRCRFSGGEWTAVDLTMADLSYSSMAEMKLQRGILRGTTLRRADLAGAFLVDANLSALPLARGDRVWPTNLEGANLRNADLRGAILDGAILRGADLRGCSFEGISARKVNFENAKR